jgi:hypothetical protein
MSNPNIHSLRPPTPGSMGIPIQGQPRKNLNADESMLWLEHFMAAAHRTPRIALDISTHRNPDGSMTITARPNE